MNSSGPGEFGRRLRELREAASLSQEELAERANLTGKAIGALERGERRRPYPTTVRALCEALDLDDAHAAVLSEAARPVEHHSSRAHAVLGSVPIPPTSMVGRETEVERVLALLRSDHTRVVTVTGAGGVGKTRVAWEVATRLAADHRRIVVVELAAVRRVDLVMPTIARAFGLQTSSGNLVQSVAEHVGDRDHVLVLDNFEHLLGAATDVAELIRHCSGIVVLATSRAPLRIRAEREVPLEPLPVPTDADDADAVASSPAAQVFAERAGSVAPDFVLDRSNASAVAAICRRLDGLPLALELAAAHVQYLGPSLLLSRLDHALESGRLRDLPERQRTMRATLDWSYGLLTSDEQLLLRSLSVFAGGFDLDAAEQVAASPGRDLLSALEGLIEQSLVVGPDVGDPGGTARFRLLEPVRDYAAALMSADEADDLAVRHAEYVGALGDQARAGLHGLDLAVWLDRLERNHANLRGALTTMVERRRLGLAARLGRSTWLYWALRGHAGEGLRWWQRVLDDGRGSELDDVARASAYVTMAGLRLASGDVDSVRSEAEHAVRTARAVDDPALLAESLVLACSGAIFTGDLADAAVHLSELWDVCATVHDDWVVAHALIAQAQLLMMQSDVDAAVRALDEAEHLARSSAGPFTLGTVLNMRTTLAQRAGDDATALKSAVEAARVAANVGTVWTMVYTLPALATLAARGGRPDLATALFSAGVATAEKSLVAVAFRPDSETADTHLHDVRARLTDDEFARAWERGRTLGIDDVLEMIPEISVGHEPS